jgi:cobalt-zinc-cadmium resistance protein CzcA
VTVANDKVDYLQFDIDRAAAGRVGMPSTTCRTRCAQVEGAAGAGVRRGDSGAQDAGVQSFADQLYRSPSGQLVRERRGERAPWKGRSSWSTRTDRASR